MRLKLVLVSSLIAAVVGAGSAIAIILFVFESLKPITTPGLLVLSTYLLPVLTTLLASIFVYRHTARRRKLQAVLTTIVALLLTISVFVLASIITARRSRSTTTWFSAKRRLSRSLLSGRTQINSWRYLEKSSASLWLSFNRLSALR